MYPTVSVLDKQITSIWKTETKRTERLPENTHALLLKQSAHAMLNLSSRLVYDVRGVSLARAMRAVQNMYIAHEDFIEHELSVHFVHGLFV